jgi:POT family proton-dependent oligopeptide transporter
MLLIPFNNLVLYPFLRQRGWAITSLRRMTWGIVFSGIAWVVAGGLQLVIDDGSDKVSILWQILPYALLTFGEVLVSATGLEFAYSQAPLAMKGVIMSFWNLTTTVGNLWVLVADAAIRNEGRGRVAAVTSSIRDTGISEIAFQMFFFAGFAFAAAAAFKLYVRRYKVLDNYRLSGGKGKPGVPGESRRPDAQPLPEARIHKDDGDE